jgi:large subunit ribosomal protein L21
VEAVIATGGKQYRVREGSVIRVEALAVERGGSVEFRPLLLYDESGVVRDPESLAGSRVVGEVVSEGRARKVTVVKFKKRKNYRRTRGHRQPFVGIRITRIEE